MWQWYVTKTSVNTHFDTKYYNKYIKMIPTCDNQLPKSYQVGDILIGVSPLPVVPMVLDEFFVFWDVP